MDDLLKNLRALARGKHDDFSVVYDAIKEITRLRLLVRHKKRPGAKTPGLSHTYPRGEGTRDP